ncbi:MAG: KEOPS complex subunit Pcc1 [Candidatus ainarchaeum sp.]|nr:KEOPS complex subunit Pcc1 [Candidatus ainarchaeum sp.]
MVEGTVRVGFDSVADAKAALCALKSECGDFGRSKSAAKRSGKEVVVSVKAGDVVALRASLNTCLRLLSVVKNGLGEGV